MYDQLDEMAEARRADLLATLFERVPCGTPRPTLDRRAPLSNGGAGYVELDEQACPHRAGGRAREEALRALLAIYSSRGQPPHLNNLDMSGMRLISVDFTGANLDRSNFSEAVLAGVKFDGALIHRALFRGAHLDDVSFIRSQAMLADFEAAHLHNVSFDSADLTHANLDINMGLNVTARQSILWSASVSGLAMMEVGGADLRCAWILDRFYGESSTVSFSRPLRFSYERWTTCPDGTKRALCDATRAPWCIQVAGVIPYRQDAWEVAWLGAMQRYFAQPDGWPEKSWQPDAGSAEMVGRLDASLR